MKPTRHYAIIRRRTQPRAQQLVACGCLTLSWRLMQRALAILPLSVPLALCALCCFSWPPVASAMKAGEGNAGSAGIATPTAALVVAAAAVTAVGAVLLQQAAASAPQAAEGDSSALPGPPVTPSFADADAVAPATQASTLGSAATGATSQAVQTGAAGSASAAADSEDRYVPCAEQTLRSLLGRLAQTQTPGQSVARASAGAELCAADCVPNYIGPPRQQPPSTQELHALLSAARRAQRDGKPISMDIVRQLQRLVDAGWGEVHVETNADASVKELWAAFVSPDMKEMIAKFPEMCTVMSCDFTHGTSSNSNLQLGAQVGFCAEAGGLSAPTAVFVYLAGSKQLGEKTRAFRWYFDASRPCPCAPLCGCPRRSHGGSCRRFTRPWQNAGRRS